MSTQERSESQPNPPDRLYTDTHEWVQIDGEVATIGITDYAQHCLGDIVYVGLPVVGDQVKHLEAMGAIESNKASSDLYSPLSGKVIEVNESILDHPELVNHHAFSQGWMIRVRMSNPQEAARLLSADAYSRGEIIDRSTQT